MNFCVPCIRGIHESCKAVLLGTPTYCECSHATTATSPVNTVSITSSPTTHEDMVQAVEDSTLIPDLFSTDEPDEVITVKSRRYKSDAALKDQQSTGRKRAAKLYPLDREAECEWAEQTNAGGGVTIAGCGLRIDSKGMVVPKGKQQSRHHGPDYNTLNNDPGNVHRICHNCHNSWHAVNDPVKDEAYLALYGVRPSMEALSDTAKQLRSGGPLVT